MGGSSSTTNASTKYQSEVAPLLMLPADQLIEALQHQLPPPLRNILDASDIGNCFYENRTKCTTLNLQQKHATLWGKYRLISIDATSIFADDSTSNLPVDINAFQCLHVNTAKEIAVLRSGAHHGMVQLLAVGIEQDYVYLVTSHWSKLNLCTFMNQQKYQPVSHQRCLNIFYQILSTLQYCLKHRNDDTNALQFYTTGIHPNSISINAASDQIQLSPCMNRFRHYDDTDHENTIGLEYMSPEECTDPLSVGSAATGVWSAACVLGYLVCGAPPFGTREMKGGVAALKKRIRNKSPRFVGHRRHFRPQVKEAVNVAEISKLCKSMLHKSGTKRMPLNTAISKTCTLITGNIASIDDGTPIQNSTPIQNKDAHGDSVVNTNVLEAKRRFNAATKITAVMRGTLLRLRLPKRNQNGRTTKPKKLSLALSMLETKSDEDLASINDEVSGGNDVRTHVLCAVSLGDSVNGGRLALNGTISGKLLLPALKNLSGVAEETKEAGNSKEPKEIKEIVKEADKKFQWLVENRIAVGQLPLNNMDDLESLKKKGVSRFFSMSNDEPHQQQKLPYYNMLKSVWLGKTVPTSPLASLTRTMSGLLSVSSNADSAATLPEEGVPHCSQHYTCALPLTQCMADDKLLELVDLCIESILMGEILFLHSDRDEGRQCFLVSAIVLGKMYSLDGSSALRHLEHCMCQTIAFSHEQKQQILRVLV